MESQAVPQAVAVLPTPGVLEERARSLRLQSGALHPVVGRAFCRRASELELMACAVRAGGLTTEDCDPDHTGSANGSHRRRLHDPRLREQADPAGLWSGGSPTAA